jgi:hypothetical protein
VDRRQGAHLLLAGVEVGVVVMMMMRRRRRRRRMIRMTVMMLW